MVHHISPSKAKKIAMTEIVRVVKEGGRIVIYDEPFTVKLCAKLMRQNGLRIEKQDKDMVFGVKLSAQIPESIERI